MSAKRGNNLYPVDYTLRDIYKKYKKEVDKNIQVDYNTFNKVMKLFGEKVISKILNESEEVKIPCALGTLSVRKSKLRLNYNMYNNGVGGVTLSKTCHLKPDWAETKKRGKIVYHLNEHRDGYKYRFLWKRGKVNNITAYSLVPLRVHKRALAFILKNRPERDYFL